MNSKELEELSNLDYIDVNIDILDNSRLFNCSTLQEVKKEYKKLSKPFKQQIEKLGGKFLDEIYLVGCMEYSIPKNAMESIKSIKGISIVIPKELERE